MTTLPFHASVPETQAVPALPMGAHAVTLPCGTALQLLPQRALWWPAARMVMVADVHFGKAATFRRAGQPVPHGTTADNLARLDAVLAATGADHLVFLGDFLHARSGAADELWQQLLPWRQRHAHVARTLVRGNHDQHAGDPPAALALAVVNEPWLPCAGACLPPPAGRCGPHGDCRAPAPHAAVARPGAGCAAGAVLWVGRWTVDPARLRGLHRHGARSPARALGAVCRPAWPRGGCSRGPFIGCTGGWRAAANAVKLQSAAG